MCPLRHWQLPLSLRTLVLGALSGHLGCRGLWAVRKLGCRKRPCVGVLASCQHEPPDMEAKLCPPYGSMNSAGPPSHLQVSQVRPQTSSNTEKPSPLCPTPIPDTQNLQLFLCFKVAGYTTMLSGIIHHCNYSSFLCLHECGVASVMSGSLPSCEL